MYDYGDAEKNKEHYGQVRFMFLTENPGKKLWISVCNEYEKTYSAVQITVQGNVTIFSIINFEKQRNKFV